MQRGADRCRQVKMSADRCRRVKTADNGGTGGRREVKMVDVTGKRVKTEGEEREDHTKKKKVEEKDEEE